MTDCLDLFCGGGGSSTGIVQLGLAVFGVDYDTDSIKTHEAAGHESLQADIGSLTLADIPASSPYWWISAPCTAFSNAGARKGQQLAQELVEAVSMSDFGWGREHDPTVWLSLKALELVLEARPEAMVWENVVPIKPLYEAIAAVLGANGYRTGVWTLRSEQWGVAQTRTRCFLAARREEGEELAPPAPLLRPHVNARYVKKRQATDAEAERLGLGHWVSMAEALGWDEPGAALNTGRDWKKGGSRADAQCIPLSEPSPTLSAIAGPQWQWQLRGTVMANGTVRQATEPAMTLGFGKSFSGPGSWSWEQDGTGIRKMTVEEVALLQAFPHGHPFVGKRTSQHRQVGNAVPPVLALVTMAEALGMDWRLPLWRYLARLYRHAPGALHKVKNGAW